MVSSVLDGLGVRRGRGRLSDEHFAPLSVRHRPELAVLAGRGSCMEFFDPSGDGTAGAEMFRELGGWPIDCYSSPYRGSIGLVTRTALLARARRPSACWRARRAQRSLPTRAAVGANPLIMEILPRGNRRTIPLGKLSIEIVAARIQWAMKVPDRRDQLVLSSSMRGPRNRTSSQRIAVCTRCWLRRGSPWTAPGMSVRLFLLWSEEREVWGQAQAPAQRRARGRA